MNVKCLYYFVLPLCIINTFASQPPMGGKINEPFYLKNASNLTMFKKFNFFWLKFSTKSRAFNLMHFKTKWFIYFCSNKNLISKKGVNSKLLGLL